MFSFWEKRTFWKSPDVVVLGSGIVGLNAALQLKRRSPELDIRVIERGFLPYGASTRNAGFACFGSLTELAADLRERPMDEVMGLVELRWKGLEALRETIGDEGLGYEPLGGFEVFTESDDGNLHASALLLPELNRRLESITGEKETFRMADRKIDTFGLTGIRHMVENVSEGQVDTGKMMERLIGLVRQAGIGLHTGVHVERIEEHDTGITLLARDGFRLDCKYLLLANNGFAARLDQSLDVRAARAQVLITEPIDGLRLKGSFHYDEGYYYFRNVGDRVLIGGGRNLDFEGEYTDEMGLSGLIQDRIEDMLRKTIVCYTEPSISLRWSGIMGLGENKSPIIRRLTPRSWCGVRMGGMGVAIGTLIGRQLAELYLRDCQGRFPHPG